MVAECPSGLRAMRAEEVNGRKRRVRKLGIVEAMMMMRRAVEMRVVVRGFRLELGVGLSEWWFSGSVR